MAHDLGEHAQAVAYLQQGLDAIEAAREAFAICGLREDRLFYDSFEFGLDVPVRVLAQPH